jgi:hypothetical protein
MTTSSRLSLSRTAIITFGIAAVVAVTVLRPSWPRDLWLRATTQDLPFQFSTLGACDERDAYQPDEITLGKDMRSVQAFVSLNCAEKPGEPSASRRSNTIFLRTKSVPIDPQSDLSAACYCSNKVTFTLESAIRPGERVVYISDSFEGAKLIAP